LLMLSAHAGQSCDTAQQNQPKRSEHRKGQKWGETNASVIVCMYVCSIVLCLWPGFGPNPQNERNSCNKETKLALSEHRLPNVQRTLPPPLYTHLVTCLPSSPVEALVSTHDLFLPSHSQHRPQPTTTCIPMVISTKALYTVNRTIPPSHADVFFDQGCSSFWSFLMDSRSKFHSWFGMLFLSVQAELTFCIADRRSDGFARRAVRQLACVLHYLLLQLQSGTLLHRTDH